jgi:hypothetical protein
MLIAWHRAFDTGSDKVWNSINRGVRTVVCYLRTCANSGNSANGETLSSDTWRLPRMTSRKAAIHGLEHGIDSFLRLLETSCTVWCILQRDIAMPSADPRCV